MTFHLNPPHATGPSVEVTIGDVCEPPQYGYTASAEPEPVGPHMLRITDIRDGHVDWSRVPYCACDAPENFLLRRDDLLVARTGSVGKTFLVHDCPEAVFASYLIRLRPRDCILPEYLYWFCQTPQYWQQIEEYSQGIGRLNVNGRNLQKIRLPLPNLGEQRLIVNQIKELMDRSRRARGALTTVQYDLRAYRRRCLSITQEGHPLCADSPWPYVELGDLTSTVTSGSRGWAKYYSASGSPFIRVGNLDRWSVDLDLSQTVCVNAPQDAEAERTRVHSGDVLITITADVGMVAVVPPSLGEAFINQHVALCRPNDAVIPRYLAYALLNPDGFQKQVQEMEYGMTKASLSLGQLRSISVPVPPIREQKRIIDWLDTALSLVTAIELKVENEAQRLVELEKTILAEAFIGRL